MARDINGEVIPSFEEAGARTEDRVKQAADFQQKLATPSLIATDSGSMLPVTNSDDVALAALSDAHSVNPDEIFTVKSYDGKVGEVKGADLQKVLASGDYVLESKEERLLREDDSKYGSRNLESAALGAARGLTFGLSDVGLAGSGEYTGDELRGLENANKAASIGGEIGGVLAPSLLSGGTGALAQSAKFLSTGVRATEALGAKAAAKVALRAEGMAANQAATAAKVLAEAGEAAAAGSSTLSIAGADAATGLLAKSLQKGGYAAKQANNIATKMLYGTAEHLAPEAANLAVQGALQGAGRLVTEDVFGTAEFNAENLVAYAGLGALVGGTFGATVGAGKALIPKAADMLAPAASRVGNFVTDTVNSIAGKEKAALNLVDLTPAALAKARVKRPDFDSLLTNEVDDILRIEKPKNYTEFDQAVIKKHKDLGSEIGSVYKEADEAIAKNMSEGATNVVQASVTPEILTANLQRAVDEHLVKLGAAVTKSEKAALFNIADDFITNVSKELAEEPVTASVLKKYADALADRIYPKTAGPTLLTAEEQSATMLRKTLRDAVKKEQMEIVKRASAIQGADPIKGALLDRLLKANKSYSVLSDVVHNSQKSLAKDTLKGGLDLALDTKDAAVAIATGALGAAAFKAARIASDSFAVQKRLAMGALDNSGRKMASAMKTGLNALAKGTKEAARVAEPSIVRSLVSSELAVRNENGKKMKPRNEAEAYNNIIDNANQAVLDPEAVLKHSNKQTSALYEHAPNTAAAIDAKYLQVLQFIAAKSKKSSKNKGIFDSKNIRPSGFETAKMARYLDAITNPQSMVEKAAKGKLSREHVEVMKNIFPEMHKQMQQSTLSFLSAHKEKGGKLTYQQQLQLGQLLGVQAHESTDPANVQSLQALFTQDASSDSDFTPARADSLNKADNVGGGVYDSVDSDS